MVMASAEPPSTLNASTSRLKPSSSSPLNNPSPTGMLASKEKPQAVRLSNIVAAKSVADVVKSSLGPRGMDKMIKTARGETIITNDGATILKHMNVLHPASQMLVSLAEAQDVAAGDGTTSVVILAGALLGAAEKLLARGIHPSRISDAFLQAANAAVSALRETAIPVRLEGASSINNKDNDALLLRSAATTSLNSKIVAQYGNLIASIAVEAVMRVADPASRRADLADIRVIKKVGGTIEDCQLVEGLLLKQGITHPSSATTLVRMEKARIGLIQFQLSPPKTDMEGSIVINDYQQMDRVLAEERAYLLNLCKRIKKANCNVLLVQKSILRDAISELALQYLAKLKIMVITDIEREEIELIAKTLNCRPIADIESFNETKLAYAELVEEIHLESGSTTTNTGGNNKYVHISGIKGSGRTASIICRGANDMVVEEVERSLHDALCVVRCLVREPALVVGGGAAEVEMAIRLNQLASTQVNGTTALAMNAFAEALLTIPNILAENAGMSPPLAVVTELRNWHAARRQAHYGINVRKGGVGDMREEQIWQPLMVTSSAVTLATETVAMILKIDDVVACR